MHESLLRQEERLHKKTVDMLSEQASQYDGVLEREVTKQKDKIIAEFESNTNRAMLREKDLSIAEMKKKYTQTMKEVEVEKNATYAELKPLHRQRIVMMKQFHHDNLMKADEKRVADLEDLLATATALEGVLKEAQAYDQLGNKVQKMHVSINSLEQKIKVSP